MKHCIPKNHRSSDKADFHFHSEVVKIRYVRFDCVLRKTMLVTVADHPPDLDFSLPAIELSRISPAHGIRVVGGYFLV